MSSFTELKYGQLTHGCLVKASRGKNEFEQTIEYERSEFGLHTQYSESYVFIDPNTGQVSLQIVCVAGHPHMLENTTLEFNVFDTIVIGVHLDIERQFVSSHERDQYLRELIQSGFNVSVSARNSPYLDDINQVTINSPLFQAGEVSGSFHVPYRLLGIWSQPSPNCNGGVFYPRNLTIKIPPQDPEDFTSYLYRYPRPRKIRKEAIYIPEWNASGVIEGYVC